MAKIITPTRDGFDLVEQIPKTRSQREWKSIFPGHFADSDNPFTLYTLERTGETLKHLEFVGVEPIISSTFSRLGNFYDSSVEEVYKRIIGMAERKRLPFVALSENSIRQNIGITGSEIYFAQFYRD